MTIRQSRRLQGEGAAGGGKVCTGWGVVAQKARADAFRQVEDLIFDIEFLATLPKDELRSGLVKALKRTRNWLR